MEDPKRIQVMGRERGKQQGLPELKSQKRVKTFIHIQDPENMQHIGLKKESRTTNEQTKCWKEKSTRPS